jgi:hypothetical protein
LLRYHIHKRNFSIVYVAVSPTIMAQSRRFSKLSLRPINITSAASTFIFAIAYGMIEHTLLASPMGISVLVYPLNIHIFEQIYFYHIVMLTLAILISFNPFFDKLIFGIDGTVKRQSILWGTGNILNFVWLEDMFYFVSFGEWPKDVMTSLHISFYGVVWWYPILLGIASYLYYCTTKIIRKPSQRQQLEKEEEQQDV